MSYRPFIAKAMRVVPFVIALMAIAIVSVPGGSVQAQQAATTVQYNENDTVPVITLTATDPEGASPIVWSLVLPTDSRLTSDEQVEGLVASNDDAEDSADFKISDDGVLEFRNKPDFENPVDAAPPNQPNNEYKALVQASDGTRMSWFKVAVMVTDVEEEGSVKLSPPNDDNDVDNRLHWSVRSVMLLQPQVGVSINAHRPDR